VISTERVRLAESSRDNPLALLVADLIRQNLEANPEKVAVMEALHLVITIRAHDLDAEVTLVFAGPRGLDVHHEAPVAPQVTIHADSESILDLARLSVHRGTGLPVLWDDLGRSIVQRLLRGTMRITPFGRHLGKLTRLLNVMSVAD
jgi:hypothetical protein